MRMLQFKTVAGERIRRLLKIEERLAFDGKATDLKAVLRWIKKATKRQRRLAPSHLCGCGAREDATVAKVFGTGIRKGDIQAQQDAVRIEHRLKRSVANVVRPDKTDDDPTGHCGDFAP